MFIDKASPVQYSLIFLALLIQYCIIVSATHIGSEGQYAATESYIAQESDEITLQQGWVVEVVKKSIEGWWTVKYVYHPTSYDML